VKEGVRIDAARQVLADTVATKGPGHFPSLHELSRPLVSYQVVVCVYDFGFNWAWVLSLSSLSLFSPPHSSRLLLSL
jgi:hypothetical protein